MRSETGWREQVTRLEHDNESGASEIAKACARALIAYASQEKPDSVDAVTQAVTQIATRILTKHPSMASVVRVFNDVLLALAEAEVPHSALDGVRRICNEHIALAEQAKPLVAETALQILPRQGTITTLSYSTAVADSLILAHSRGYQHRVICLESRPMLEGRNMAAALAATGLKVSLAVDASAYSQLQRSELLCVGADSMTAQGVINKIGTCGAAVCAGVLHVPVVVVADTSKVWPSRLGVPGFAQHSAAEVWDNDSVGLLTINNIYFDLTLWENVGSIVTERSILDASAIIELSQSLRVAPLIESIL